MVMSRKTPEVSNPALSAATGASRQQRFWRHSQRAPGPRPDRTNISRIISTFSRRISRPLELDQFTSCNRPSFPVLHRKMLAQGPRSGRWVDHAIVKERHASSTPFFLFPICEALKEAGDVIVIKLSITGPTSERLDLSVIAPPQTS